ncbi:MAG: arylsulfatase family protein [Chthoniobacteraceae bacterium]|nr:arylsulfatase family protein [Chthoniobacteraceae bacterium]
MKPRFSLPLAVLAFAGLAITAQAADKKKPNILVIVADDLGYGELSVQGFTKEIPTPNVDSIAGNGIRFTSGYVSGPYCSPTRAGLLTGRYQQRFGHEFNPGPAQNAGEKAGLPLTEKTLGDRLKAAGYATGWFGKSHLGYEPEFHPLRRGFDEYFGFLGGAHSYLDAEGKGRDPIQKNGVALDKIDYSTDAFGRETAGFIEKHKDQPWFAYLAFNAVHEPLKSTEKYLSRFPNITDPKRKEFAAGLSALDDNVGLVLAKLRELNLEEETLIFFFNDNGGPTRQTTSSNGPLRGFKAQTWEGGIRIAYIVQWKGHIPAGKVDDRPVIQLDIFPTALAAAQVPLDPSWKVEGVNLLPYLSGEKPAAPHDALYWRFGQQIAIRKGDWKLVKAPGGGAEQGENKGVADTHGAQLYNLSKDIGEQTNLASAEPEKLKELAGAWDVWNRENIEPKWTPGGPRARKAVAAAETGAPVPSTSAAQGPWKTGDSLSGQESPQIARHSLSIAARIDDGTPNGVIVAQGARKNGFALYLKDGKLAFALRIQGELTAITSNKAVGPGAHSLEARLGADGKVVLLIDGESAGEGNAPGSIPSQPGEGLTVGSDGKGAVGDYSAPNDFTGKVDNVTVKVL